MSSGYLGFILIDHKEEGVMELGVGYPQDFKSSYKNCTVTLLDASGLSFSRVIRVPLHIDLDTFMWGIIEHVSVWWQKEEL